MRASRSEYRASVEGFTCANTAPSYHDKATMRRGLAPALAAFAAILAFIVAAFIH